VTKSADPRFFAVTDLAGVTTITMISLQDGANTHEIALTTFQRQDATFGQNYSSEPVDGAIYANLLWVGPSLTLAPTKNNVHRRRHAAR